MARIRYIDDRRFAHPVPVEESSWLTFSWAAGLHLLLAFVLSGMVGYILTQPMNEINHQHLVAENINT